jgi:hypothetical protein
MRAAVLVVAIALASSARARADEPAPHKSPRTAIALSIGITLGGIGLDALGAATNEPILAGIGGLAGALGPTTGHWYAGEAMTPGLGIRLAGSAVATIGIVGVIDCFFQCKPDPIYMDLVYVGAAAWVGGAIYDIATAGDAADDYNRAHERAVIVAPTAMRGTRGDTAPGLAVTVRF